MIITLILWFVLGALLGSFALVVAARYKLDGFKSSLTGRSRCDHCKHALSWSDLIPLISFLTLKGKCRHCHKKISPNHLAAEIGLGLVAVLLAFRLDSNIVIGLNLIIITLLITVAYIDYLSQNVLEGILLLTVPLVLILLFINQVNYINTLYAILAGFGVFFLLFAISRGQWMGFGDVEVATLLGLWLGFPDVVLAIMVAFISGAVYGVYLLSNKKAKLGARLPFVPFLVFGGIVTLLFGKPIISWYLGGI